MAGGPPWEEEDLEAWKVMGSLHPSSDRSKASVVLLCWTSSKNYVVLLVLWDGDRTKKMYQTFLQVWQEGKLTDFGSGGTCGSDNNTRGKEIDCSQAIFVCTTNEGQDKIIEFAEENHERVYGKCGSDDVDWIQSKFVRKYKEEVLMKFFESVSPELQALVRRINLVVPFLPFTEDERHVVSDLEIRNVLSRWRDPPTEKRGIGNIVVHHTAGLVDLVAQGYAPMEGASSLIGEAQRVAQKASAAYYNGKLEQATEDGHSRKVCWLHTLEDDPDTVTVSLKEPPARSRVAQTATQCHAKDAKVAAPEENEPEVSAPMPSVPDEFSF